MMWVLRSDLRLAQAPLPKIGDGREMVPCPRDSNASKWWVFRLRSLFTRAATTGRSRVLPPIVGGIRDPLSNRR